MKDLKKEVLTMLIVLVIVIIITTKDLSVMKGKEIIHYKVNKTMKWKNLSMDKHLI